MLTKEAPGVNGKDFHLKTEARSPDVHRERDFLPVISNNQKSARLRLPLLSVPIVPKFYKSISYSCFS
jgi:hypothetical protein